MKVIIVGGVAGGASCAARLRRLDEKAEILMVERGPYVSYANCGLPYHVGGVIEEESSLLVATEQMFRAIFNVDCRTRCEAVGISPQGQDRRAQEPRHRRGDHRALRQARAVARRGADPPAAARHRPAGDLLGADRAGRAEIREWLERGASGLAEEAQASGFRVAGKPQRAVVVGGGYIGLEMAENLAHRGLEVTIVEMLDQVMAPLDPECARLVERHLEKHGVHLALGDAVAGFRQNAERLARGPHQVRQGAPGGHRHPRHRRAAGDRAGEGRRPRDRRSAAASASTSRCAPATRDIFAVGDAVEVKDFVTGEWALIPLAGPANRQGRIAADVIAGRDSRFRGTQGTSVIGLFGARSP